MDNKGLKCSPAPWRIKWDYERPYKVYAANRTLVATIPNHSGRQSREDSGNVSLTRHAPDMYVLLKMLLAKHADNCNSRQIGGGCCGGCEWAKVRELVQAIENTELNREDG